MERPLRNKLIATTLLIAGAGQAAIILMGPATVTPSPPSNRPSGSLVSAAPAPEAPISAPTPAAPRAAKNSRPGLNPDPLNPTGYLIEIRVHSQRLILWRNGERVLTADISTGRPGYETPEGRFHVYGKLRKAWSRPWQVWMPNMLAFHGNYSIHGLPYHPGEEDRPIGASRLGRPDSHGCVRIGPGDSEKLYDLAKVGTPVWIHGR